MRGRRRPRCAGGSPSAPRRRGPGRRRAGRPRRRAGCPAPTSTHGYIGSSWYTDVSDRSSRLRSATFSGPSFFTNPLTRKSTAFSEPRCGVPNVISARVSCQPPRHSRYQRATSPPIECPMRTTLASGLRWRWAAASRRRARCSWRAATRLSRRQSYGNSMYVSPGDDVERLGDHPRDAAVDVDAPEPGDEVHAGISRAPSTPSPRSSRSHGSSSARATSTLRPSVHSARPTAPGDGAHTSLPSRAARCRGSRAAAPRRHPTVAWPSTSLGARGPCISQRPSSIISCRGWPPTSTRTSG